MKRRESLLLPVMLALIAILLLAIIISALHGYRLISVLIAAATLLMVNWVFFFAGARLELATAAATNHQRTRNELQEKDEALKRSRTCLRAAVDSMPEAVAILFCSKHDTALSVDMANARAERLGMTPGKSFPDLPLAWLHALVDQAIRSRTPVGGTDEAHAMGNSLVQIFEDGRERFLLPRVTPLIDETNNVIGATVVIADVTAARQTAEAKSNLLSSFSHDLKTPMTSIQMSIHLLVEDAASRLTPRQLELLTAARDDSDRLHRVLEAALAGAKNAS